MHVALGWRLNGLPGGETREATYRSFSWKPRQLIEVPLLVRYLGRRSMKDRLEWLLSRRERKAEKKPVSSSLNDSKQKRIDKVRRMLVSVREKISF